MQWNSNMCVLAEAAVYLQYALNKGCNVLFMCWSNQIWDGRDDVFKTFLLEMKLDNNFIFDLKKKINVSSEWCIYSFSTRGDHQEKVQVKGGEHSVVVFFF